MDEERLARDLLKRAHEAALACQTRVEGAGLHWRVEFAGAGRRCIVHCFWYAAAAEGLRLGVNPGNARQRPARPRPPYVGPEYLLVLQEAEDRIAGGRTRIADQALACAGAWVDRGLSLEKVEEELPFVDAKRRRLRQLRDELEGAGRIAIEAEIGYELWVYGSGRSCQLQPDGDDRHAPVTCSFYLGQAQVARAEIATDLRSVVAGWLAQWTLSDLLACVPGAEMEPHADLLERGEAGRWHWQHVRDRLAAPQDVLVPLKPLITRLLERPAVTEFFSFSSLTSLCFSASSHYPWVRDGLPVIWPTERGQEVVVEIGEGRTSCGNARAVDLIESTLAAYPIRPFVGSEPMRSIGPLAAELARQGCALEPRLVQRRQWYEVVVASGERWCCLSGDAPVAIEFAEPKTRASGTWPSLVEGVHVVRRWLERGAALDEVAGDPNVTNFSRQTIGFDPD